MSSEESDDEPLSVLASKRLNAANSELEILPIYASEVKLPKSKKLKKECDVSISLQPSLNDQSVVERPTDVWLYLTDLNTCGPFSCLLCSEWFLNKARIVIHYVVDHRKDYCGICRYFVPNREAWWEHKKFHTPWRCSQCTESFDTEKELRQHFSRIHNLVHCRLCYLRLPDNEEYHNHLFQKHGTSDISSIRGDYFWEFQYSTQKFFCLLCLKKFDLGKQFADHFIAFHHFTLKCLTFLICGTDLQFNIKGVDLSQEFIETELKLYCSYGYVDFQKCLKIKDETEIEEVSITVDCDPGIKEAADDSHSDDNLKLVDSVAGYRGDVDFDVTLIELILLPKCYYKYVDDILKKINSKVMPHSSVVSYLNPGGSTACVTCFLCKDLCKTVTAFECHMSRAHCVKTLPLFWCRVCAADFENSTELENHSKEELAEFDDLWICQFCEKEFDGREETRKHLTEHFSIIDYDNCFSPHLGFKCKYCPTLFWNETDREMHHVRVHIQRHKSDFYSCLLCGDVFSDKIFFVHHYIEKHGTKTTHLLRCRLCGIMLQNIDEMRSHFKSEHPLSRRIFCCMDACKFRPFQHRKALLLHMKSVHDPASKFSRSVTCSVCGQQFNSNKARVAHTLQAHGIAKFKCTLCSVVLHTADERKFHYLIRHPGRYQYQCDMCEKSFQYKSSLYMHKKEHSPYKRDYACNYCGKVFMKKDSFREHVQIHEAPRHACSYCPMRFVQRSNMLRHERRHTGERPYSCNYCPRTFSDKGACTSHTRTHGNNTSYVCVYCGQAFAQKSKLKYHIRKHTGENLETCQTCAKVFTSACALREHMRVHLKQNMKKTIKCPLCKNMYPTEKDMVRHMRGSHTATRYKCPLCRKLVSSTGSLRDHVLTHTNVKAFRCKSCLKSYTSRKTIIKHLLLRHHIKRSEVNNHYHHLDPKECNIDLNDDVMKKIFSNLKSRPNAKLFKEFLATNKDIIEAKKDMVKATKRSTRKKQETADEPEKNVDIQENEDSQKNMNVVIEEVSVKLEPCEYSDNSEDEIPPSDFVNVKIECVEENKIETE